MKKNFDYVSMDDYKKDTQELVEQSAGIIQGQAAEIRIYKLLIRALVKGAGGRIEVPSTEMGRIDDYELIMEYSPQRDCLIYRVEEKHGAPLLQLRKEDRGHQE